MSLPLYRIDDRLIHGQVVVGWGKPLGIEFIVLVDDQVAGSEWEQELYRMGVPPGVDVYFNSVADVVRDHERYTTDSRRGILLTGTAATMLQLIELVPTIRTVNVGGIHHRPGRVQKLRYVFLTQDEEQTLQTIATRGVEVTAQDLPSTRAVSLEELIRGDR